MLAALPASYLRVRYLTMPVAKSAGEILEAVVKGGREELSRAQHLLRAMILSSVN
jgi:hypothetical protein